jgi:hypothetical protein
LKRKLKAEKKLQQTQSEWLVAVMMHLFIHILGLGKILNYSPL